MSNLRLASSKPQRIVLWATWVFILVQVLYPPIQWIEWKYDRSVEGGHWGPEEVSYFPYASGQLGQWPPLIPRGAFILDLLNNSRQNGNDKLWPSFARLAAEVLATLLAGAGLAAALRDKRVEE